MNYHLLYVQSIISTPLDGKCRNTTAPLIVNKMIVSKIIGIISSFSVYQSHFSSSTRRLKKRNETAIHKKFLKLYEWSLAWNILWSWSASNLFFILKQTMKTMKLISTLYHLPSFYYLNQINNWQVFVQSATPVEENMVAFPWLCHGMIIMFSIFFFGEIWIFCQFSLKSCCFILLNGTLD